jgi:hypothetical protein
MSLWQPQQRQQQQQPALHRAVVDAIALVTDPHCRHPHKRHDKLCCRWIRPLYASRPVDRRSLQHLVDFFLNSHRGCDAHEAAAAAAAAAVTTELVLFEIRLVSRPTADGGMHVLRDFFARSDTTTLTEVILESYNFWPTRRGMSCFGSLSHESNHHGLGDSFCGVANLEYIALGKFAGKVDAKHATAVQKNGWTRHLTNLNVATIRALVASESNVEVTASSELP